MLCQKFAMSAMSPARPLLKPRLRLQLQLLLFNPTELATQVLPRAVQRFEGLTHLLGFSVSAPVPVLVEVFGVRFSVAALRPVSVGWNGVWIGVQGCWPCTSFGERERVF